MQCGKSWRKRSSNFFTLGLFIPYHIVTGLVPSKWFQRKEEWRSLKIAKMNLSHNEPSWGGECVSITESSTRQQKKDHFPLPFVDEMLERLVKHSFFCFLDGYLGYHQIPIHPDDQSKTTFTCPYGTYAYRRMLFRLCNAPEVDKAKIKVIEQLPPPDKRQRDS
jgi:hypothetical protein